MNLKKKIITSEITIDADWCKKCGICITFCPTGVYVSDETGEIYIAHPEAYINCGLCVYRRSDFTVELGEKTETVKDGYLLGN